MEVAGSNASKKYFVTFKYAGMRYTVGGPEYAKTPTYPVPISAGIGDHGSLRSILSDIRDENGPEEIEHDHGIKVIGIAGARAEPVKYLTHFAYGSNGTPWEEAEYLGRGPAKDTDRIRSKP
jgi:hypothetical protein